MAVRGIIVPLVTFFSKELELNRNLNSLIINHAILNNADALYLFGAVGEGKYFTGNYLSYSRLIKQAIKITEDKIPILVGIYGIGQDQVIDQLEHLAKEFPNVCFVVSPPLNEKLSIADLRSYFETIFGSIEFKNELYLYNNPIMFAGNIIDPNVLNWLLSFSNLSGIMDSSDKLNNYKKYIELISEAFSVSCGKERNYTNFLQLVPKEKRFFAGLFPNIGNITNLCFHLYQASLTDDTLKMIQLQENLNDIRNKIYDVTQKQGKQQRGIKLAFKILYEDIISSDLDDSMNVCTEYQRDVDYSTIERIKATVKSLENNNFIRRFYSIGEKLYVFNQLREKFSNIDDLRELGELKRVKGPYEGKINTSYRMKIDIHDLVFRARVSKAFRSENIIKEKVLFPFLDQTIDLKKDLRGEIKSLASLNRGSHIFATDKPPIVPVGNLMYFDETKETFPYFFTVQEYMKGKPLNDVLETSKNQGNLLISNKYLKLFSKLGETLAKLHEIKFDTFYEKVSNIGKDSTVLWLDYFQDQIDNELQEAKKNKIDFIKPIKDYIKDNSSLIEEETEPVLSHNDFHGHNIIVKEDPNLIKVNGIIGFDDWQIGVRAQDFVKLKFYTFKKLAEPELEKAFFQSYIKTSRQLIKDINKKTEIYSVLWLLKNYNFEMEKIRKSEQKHTVDGRFPPAETYLFELKRILDLV